MWKEESGTGYPEMKGEVPYARKISHERFRESGWYLRVMFSAERGLYSEDHIKYFWIVATGTKRSLTRVKKNRRDQN